MKKPIITIDIDDTLALTAKGLAEWSNDRYGTSLGADDYDDDWAKMWQVEKVEAELRAIDFHEGDTVSKLEHIIEARPVLERLNRAYKLIIITSRRSVVKDQTLRWIHRYFPGIFSDEVINFAGMWDKATDQSTSITKSDMATGLGADFLIDDQLKHCISAAEHGIVALMLDNPWNKCDNLPDGVVRAKDWVEVEKYFDERA